MRHRLAVARLLACTMSVLLAGCIFDTITLPPGADRVAVHGVLNPGVTDQVILVERALTGRTLLPRAPFDSIDPIVSDGGTPISNARVVVQNSRGDSVVLREERSVRADGRGTGVYRFVNLEGVADPTDFYPRLPVEPGEQYQLRVTTADGALITGRTTVPSAIGRIASTVPRQFVRDRDSMFVGWPAISKAARYEVRIESVNGPFRTFVDSLEYLLAGSLTHTDVSGRPRVFWPGVRQLVTVSAVDSNYHDYYRGGSDEFGARGLITHLDGGVGVFGSMSRIRERILDVTADTAGSPAGRWQATTAIGVPLPFEFQLWPESQAFGVIRLSGQVISGSLSTTSVVVARQVGADLSFTVLARQSLRDTLVTVDGQLSSFGDGRPRLIGTVRGSTQSVTYRRLP